MKRQALILLCVTGLCAISCNQNEPLIKDWENYIKELEAWQQNRLERLKSEKGWLNLAGLFWLEEGENSFGSDSSNSIVFPQGFPAFGGVIFVNDSLIKLIPDPDAGITANDTAAMEMELHHDQMKNTTVLDTGNFQWFIIKRGDKYGIRLRNLEHPRISQLKEIPSYPFNKSLVIQAELVRYDSVKQVIVPTVIRGFNEEYKVPGELRFKIGKQNLTLIPFKAKEGFFLIFGDATNGISTYGAGRFLYTNAIDSNKVIIDFNKAYNPPCAFSSFATCPLPPIENNMDIEINAGEKAVHMD